VRPITGVACMGIAAVEGTAGARGQWVGEVSVSRMLLIGRTGIAKAWTRSVVSRSGVQLTPINGAGVDCCQFGHFTPSGNIQKSSARFCRSLKSTRANPLPTITDSTGPTWRERMSASSESSKSAGTGQRTKCCAQTFPVRGRWPVRNRAPRLYGAWVGRGRCRRERGGREGCGRGGSSWWGRGGRCGVVS
jgi:hypothetical protein